MKETTKGFYKLSQSERLNVLKNFSHLSNEDLNLLQTKSALPFELSNLFIENSVGSYALPLGLATNFVVNGLEYALPFAVEESSVIAAASNAARWVKNSGGFTTEILSHEMIGQIQLLDLPVEKFLLVQNKILDQKSTLIEMANAIHPRLVQRGGGLRDIEVLLHPEVDAPYMVVHLLVDTCEAMGANIVNTLCEKISVQIAELTGARIGLKILSNLAENCIFKSECRIPSENIAFQSESTEYDGPSLAKKIVEAFVFADTNPYRATTHNKGIMNGIDPIVIATGNDWRAVEAGAPAFAARTGRYRSLSKWWLEENDQTLCGKLEIPLQLGTVGGVTRLHPQAALNLKIMGSPNVEILGGLIASAGLATNLAALRALCSTGIQMGHMKLHAKNVALAAGAQGPELEIVANEMVKIKEVSALAAEKILESLRK